MKRRTVLKRAGALSGTLAVAGCLTDSPGGGGGSGGDESGDETTSPSDSDGSDDGEESTSAPSETTEGGDAEAMDSSQALASSSLETVSAGCGSGSSASVAFDGSDVSITGKVDVSDPCHEAVFADVSLEEDTLTVNVEATETDADACQQCLAVVEYSAGFEFADDGPTTVTVKHNSQGETTVVTTAER
jgi:hypothetical protein